VEWFYALVDVFAEAPLGGNPLAVVAGSVPDALMPRIAREFNQSETTFVLPPTRAGADWRLRSFTAAGVEVFGAGHNALGAWAWLVATGRAAGPVVYQEIGPSVLPVRITADGISMTQDAPEFGASASATDIVDLAAALGLGADDLTVPGLPTQVVSTGAPHLLVPARDAAVVDRARPDAARLLRVLQSLDGEGCYLFTLDGGISARFFNPTVGLWEDPATGTAAGPLACYLARYGRVAVGAHIQIAQGRAMGRPSRIDVRVGPAAPDIIGRGIIVAEGRFKAITPPSSGGAVSGRQQSA
jgi:trans-2,3-dihydro-3-hydroxyanthranilate isomerase